MAGTFPALGFMHIPGLLAEAECNAVDALLPPTRNDSGDRSLLQHSWCAALASRLRGHPAISALLADASRAVQCTLFEKSAACNWLVPVHQDLSIPVAGRVDDPALSGWSEKDGALFVQPPPAVLERLVAVRVYLDACTPGDGPVRVVPGSHVHGRLTHEAAVQLRDARGEATCAGARGDAWIMRPLLLHASSRTGGGRRRRVLHFLFAPAPLPFGLRWRHAV